MKVDRVRITEIINSYQKRIKPNGYLVEGKRTMLRLGEKGAFKGILRDYVEDVFRPGIFKRIFVAKPNFGLPYITAQGMMNIDPLATSKLLSIKQTKDLESMILKHHTVLVSCAGSVGYVRLIDKSMDGKVGSQDIIRVIPKNKYGFIYAFLNTPTIYSYLQSQIYGSVVPRLEPEIVASIPMPNFKEVLMIEVDSLIRESAQCRETALLFQEKAINLLSSYINATFFKETFKTNTINIRDIWKSLQKRLDPPVYINGGAEAINQVIDRLPYKLLGELDFTVRRPGIFKRIYVEKGLPYIKGSEIFLTNPFRRCEYLSKTKTPFH